MGAIQAPDWPPFFSWDPTAHSPLMAARTRTSLHPVMLIGQKPSIGTGLLEKGRHRVTSPVGIDWVCPDLGWTLTRANV